MDNKRNMNNKSDTIDKHGIVLVNAHDIDDKGNANDKNDMAYKSDNNGLDDTYGRDDKRAWMARATRTS